MDRLCAQELDRADVLGRFRKEFYIPEDAIYFDGNSLGLLSKRAEATLYDMVESWKKFAIDGWTNEAQPWFHLSEKLGNMTAPLIGAHPEEVITTGSTTTNLHQLAATFFKPEGQKNKILADELNFPSDIYALKSQLQIKGLDPETHLVQVKSRDGHTLTTDDIIAKMNEDVALIVLPAVLYRSGQILDMKALTKAAHERGILIGFDLCHSIGAIEHHLSAWDVDFAFWCTYKHLNGGPGSVGGLYVNQKHFDQQPGLAGWFGSDKAKQFDMSHTFTPAETAGAFQIGTPHLFSAAPLVGALELFQEAGMTHIRTKSLQLTAFLMNLVEQELSEYDFTIVNPRDDHERGGHVFLEHKEAARICKALKADGVIPDYREPNGIRLAPVALYNTFEDVYDAVGILKTIMQEKRYLEFENKRGVIA
ncbi:Kynureninase [Lentibacillus sp. JNUCC-1]|uniref:kynureninase n=1 Tax=Lentibacillus sp. JNUCC-1 TaxID=2654513 RepID=UPI0012E95CDD|nr:kynureninase [Lentibacillus sp. JNUCC-1]MUV38651.1 Kynureninase [Lentibacillus sp. JNUCC-1]